MCIGRGWVVWELIVVTASIAVLLTLVRLRVSVGIALVVEGVLIVVLMNPSSLPNVFLQTLMSERTISLVLASFSISVLVELYSLTQMINKLSEGLLGYIRRPALIIAVVPAIMGLLPIAGGALMSAPVVASVGAAIGLSTTLMAFLNVWFRHTIFLIYPMSQVLMTAAALTGHSVTELAVYQVPIMALMMLTGLYVTRRNGKPVSGSGGLVLRESSLRDVLTFLSPILGSIVVALIARQALDTLGYYSDYSVAVGGFFGVALITYLSFKESAGHAGLTKFLTALRSDRVMNMVLSSFGAMLIYYAMMNTGVSSSIGAIISSSKFPVVVTEILLPSIMSLISGSPIVGVTSSIPLLAGLKTFSLGDASLIYLSAFLSYVASPVHLCLVFTVQYFKENLFKVYKYLIPMIILTFTIAISYYYLILVIH
jgi:integral membrane protein (TIGR00529 family)